MTARNHRNWNEKIGSREFLPDTLYAGNGRAINITALLYAVNIITWHPPSEANAYTRDMLFYRKPPRYKTDIDLGERRLSSSAHVVSTATSWPFWREKTKTTLENHHPTAYENGRILWLVLLFFFVFTRFQHWTERISIKVRFSRSVLTLYYYSDYFK